MPYLQTSAGALFHEVAGDGEPVLLLHGGLCSIENMRRLGDLLAAHHRVYAFDRSGHGRTADHGDEFTYVRMVDEALAYLDAVGERDVHVVGFSDGGIIGTLMVRDHPGRVRSFVSISANLGLDGYVASDYPHVTVPEEAIAEIRDDYERTSPDGPAHIEVVEAKIERLWASEPDIDPASLAGVVAPVLVVRGEHDVISRAHSESVAAAFDAELWEASGASHMVVSEQPDAVASRILAFLRGVTT